MSKNNIRNILTRRNLRRLKNEERKWLEHVNRPTKSLEILEDGVFYFESQGYSASEKDMTTLGFLKWARSRELKEINNKDKNISK